MRHYVITFVHEKRKTPKWMLPRCGCGKLVRNYYEIEDSEDVRYYIEPRMVLVICVKCFEKFVRKWMEDN